MHWFNPLVWMAQRFVKMDCELACDQRVTAKLTEEERLHYANTLVSTAKQAYAPKAGVLATGMTMTGKRLKRRINGIIHMKAVQKVAAALVAVMLTVLTVAVFSTAESTRRTKGLTAFPFEESDVYPAPTNAVGESVALTPLQNPTDAEAQAKRYLRALYPQDQAAIEAQYRYQVQALEGERWEITVFPHSGGKPLCTMDLTSGGELRFIDSSRDITKARMYTYYPGFGPPISKTCCWTMGGR